MRNDLNQIIDMLEPSNIDYQMLRQDAMKEVEMRHNERQKRLKELEKNGSKNNKKH